MATKKKASTPTSRRTSQTEFVDPGTIKDHPKKYLVPAISKEQYEIIKADAKANGFRTPAKVNQKSVMVDGHTRKRIAIDLGIPLLIERCTFTPIEEMRCLVLDNYSRRHLTESQRAAMLTHPEKFGEIMAPFLAEAKERIKEGAKKGGKARAAAPKSEPKLEATVPHSKKVKKVARAPQVRDQVAKLAGVSGRTVTAASTAWKKAPEKMKAVMRGESSETVSSISNGVRKAEKAKAAKNAIENGGGEFENLFRLKIHDVWTFGDLDPGYGKPHPGNIPASLVANVLYYFTDPGDLVVDPMAGGGVTGDVCGALNRKCVMADLHPHADRNDIVKHTVEEGPVPGTEGKADLVFVDPPYWSMNEEKYGEGSASSKPWPEWRAWLKNLATSSAKMAKPGGYVTVLMMDSLTRDVDEGAWSKPSIATMTAAMFSVGLVPVIQIACPLPFSTGGPHDVEWAKQNKRMLGINRVLLVFQRPKPEAGA